MLMAIAAYEHVVGRDYMCEIVLKSGVREWARTNRRTYGYSLERASVYLALGEVIHLRRRKEIVIHRFF